MRWFKYLGLLVAISATGLSTAPEGLADPVEVVEGPPISHCEGLGDGGCRLHLQGEETLFFHIFGIESTEATCNVEVRAQVDQAGGSEISDYTLTNGAHGNSNCSTVAPACAASLPWSGDLEETAVDVVTWTSNVCIDPFESGTNCTGNLPFTMVRSGDQYHAGSTDIRIGASSFCEVTMDAETENDGTFDDIGINHVGEGSEVEVVEGPPISHCEGLGDGGCRLHLQGEETLFFHIFGIESTEATCNVEVRAQVDQAGGSEISDYTLTNGAHGNSNCSTVAPACAASLPWSGDLEETAVDVVTWTSNVCIDPSEWGTNCTGNLPLTMVRSGDQYHAGSTDIRIGASSVCEITIDAETENDGTFDDIGINHL